MPREEEACFGAAVDRIGLPGTHVIGALAFVIYRHQIQPIIKFRFKRLFPVFQNMPDSLRIGAKIYTKWRTISIKYGCDHNRIWRFPFLAPGGEIKQNNHQFEMLRRENASVIEGYPENPLCRFPYFRNRFRQVRLPVAWYLFARDQGTRKRASAIAPFSGAIRSRVRLREPYFRSPPGAPGARRCIQ